MNCLNHIQQSHCVICMTFHKSEPFLLAFWLQEHQHSTFVGICDKKNCLFWLGLNFCVWNVIRNYLCCHRDNLRRAEKVFHHARGIFISETLVLSSALRFKIKFYLSSFLQFLVAFSPPVKSLKFSFSPWTKKSFWDLHGLNLTSSSLSIFLTLISLIMPSSPDNNYFRRFMNNF